MAIKNWLKKTIGQVFDPDKEVRVKRLADFLFANLNGQKDKFSLSSVLKSYDYFPADLVLAKEITFNQFLMKAWVDGSINSTEQAQLNWIASKLELPSVRAQEIILQQTVERFRVMLIKSLEAGYPANEYEPYLELVANSAKLSRHQMMARYFKAEVSLFISNILNRCNADIGILIPSAESNFILAERMGLTQTEYQNLVMPLVHHCLEYELAYAKSEGMLSLEEATKLRSVCHRFGLATPEFTAVIERLENLGKIKNGNLPRLRIPNNIAVKSGEIIHYVGKCCWLSTKSKQGQSYYVDNPGDVVITDSSLLFTSAAKSFSIGFGKIIQHSYWHKKCIINSMNKPEITLHRMGDDELFYCILSRAVELYNQQLVGKSDTPSRSIPRAVRQRVWQRDGGKCVDCAATDYLEFDHIIPHSRGGSNLDANIQLLCRRCNGKKSDNI